MARIGSTDKEEHGNGTEIGFPNSRSDGFLRVVLVGGLSMGAVAASASSSAGKGSGLQGSFNFYVSGGEAPTSRTSGRSS